MNGPGPDAGAGREDHPPGSPEPDVVGPGPPDGSSSPRSDGPEPATSSSTPSSSTPSSPSARSSRPGASTFTIEGRTAPALFVVGWLASILGLGIIVIAAMAGAGGSPIIAIAGLVILSIGLIAAGGSQGVERRARGRAGYQGPSPLLVFAAAIPVSLLGVVLVGVPLGLAGVDLAGPPGQLASLAVQTAVYVALIRLLVVDTGALSWAEMGLRRFDGRAVGEMVAGALWALPVIVGTAILAAFLATLVPDMPASPLPPTGEASGLILQLIAGALLAPFGEELLFRGLATTAWVRDSGFARGVIRAAFLFAFAHVIGVSGESAGAAAATAAVAFIARIPVALVLGWLFVRRGSFWASFGLHAAYNGVLLVLADVAIRSGLLP